MIVWLPLQGFAAIAMPFCKHGFHASEHGISQSSLGHAETRHVHAGVQSASDSLTLHANTHHREGALACNACGVCRLACSPLAPTSLNAIERVSAQSFMQFSPALPPAFVPEQPTPPPLGTIV
jgi:hypothetical protein